MVGVSALIGAAALLASCGPSRPAAPHSSKSAFQFAPLSASFISPTDGFVLGGPYLCKTATCLSIRHTTDGGTSWSDIAAPPVGPYPACSPCGATVAFANDLDGWIYRAQDLWSTHDGGMTWKAIATVGDVLGLVVDDNRVYDLVTPACLATSPECSSPDLFSVSPLSADQWTQVEGIDIAAPPNPSLNLEDVGSTSGTLQLSGPFILIALGMGAPLPAATLWVFDTQTGHLVSGPTSICNEANLPSTTMFTGVAGYGGNYVIALCETGYGAGSATTQLYESSDAGRQFAPVGAEVSGPVFASIIMTSASTVFYVDGEPGNPTSLVRSVDSGVTRSAPIQGLPACCGVVWMTDLDFLSTTFGYMVVGSYPPALYLTKDGGAVWQQARSTRYSPAR